MLAKIIDFFDTNVSMMILIDNINDLCILKGIIASVGKERVCYNVYSGKHIFKNELVTYAMEIRLPYNRYLKLMQGLQRNVYNLRQESNIGVLNRMIKL